MIPDFEHEKKLWAKGYKFVAGVDEVGRGAWAGPLVAAAVVFLPDVLYEDSLMQKLKTVRDSKKLSAKKRQYFSALLLSHMKHLPVRQAGLPVRQAGRMFNVGLGSVEPAEIDDEGVTKATEKAIKRALKELTQQITINTQPLTPNLHTLVDAFSGINKQDHTPVKKGDERSVSIAAASIVAKEYRDDLMRKHAQDPTLAVYGWETNVGYGTKAHREAIVKYGICHLHRKLFVPDHLYNSS